jgi:hypothetical protein
MEYDAPGSVLVTSVATPEPFKVAAPNLPSAGSEKVTVPVGVWVEGDVVTVAVRVTLVPKLTGDAGEMLRAVAVAILTLS